MSSYNGHFVGLGEGLRELQVLEDLRRRVADHVIFIQDEM